MEREIDRLSRVSIRDAGEHRRVKIVGKVRMLGAPMVAPLSGRPCTYYDARVEEAPDALLVHETGGQDFLVEDDSGRALVRVESAQVVVKLDAQYRSQATRVTSKQQALLLRHAARARSKDEAIRLRYGGGGTLVFREGTLTVGERVAVVGIPKRELDPNPQAGVPFREMPTRLVFAGDVYVTDDEVGE